MNTQALPLEDIITPDAISWWPLAWGWWAALLLALLALGLATWFLLRYFKQRRAQRQALALLASSTQSLTHNELYAALNTWLKLQARAAYPHALNLHGQAWIDFLNHSAGQELFNGSYAQALAQGVYQPLSSELVPTVNSQELLALAQAWLSASKALKGGRHV